MLFVIVISPTQKYLLENSLSTRVTMKVCRYVQLCESIVLYNYYSAKYHKHLNNVTCLFVISFLFFFQFKQLWGVVTMALNPLYHLKTFDYIFFSSLMC